MLCLHDTPSDNAGSPLSSESWCCCLNLRLIKGLSLLFAFLQHNPKISVLYAKQIEHFHNTDNDASKDMIKGYENYQNTSKSYDTTRIPIWIEILLGCFETNPCPLLEQVILDGGCGTGN